jgi:hypothetical protein
LRRNKAYLRAKGGLQPVTLASKAALYTVKA